MYSLAKEDNNVSCPCILTRHKENKEDCDLMTLNCTLAWDILSVSLQTFILI